MIGHIGGGAGVLVAGLLVVTCTTTREPMGGEGPPSTRAGAGGDAADGFSGSAGGDDGAGAAGRGGARDVELSANDQAVAIACGDAHDCAVLRGGRVACWGRNEYRQLGGETLKAPSAVPIEVIGVDDAVGVSVGFDHTCAVTETGSVKCWGYNGEGVLGTGSSGEIFEPVFVPGLPTVVAVYAGSSKSCAVTADEEIWCWGEDIGTARRVETLGSVMGVFPYSAFGIALTRDGALYQVELSDWDNQYGQVQLLEEYPMEELSSSAILLPLPCVDDDGTIIEGLYDCTLEDDAAELARAGTFVTSGDHVCQIDETQQVRCAGLNRVGQLGDDSLDHGTSCTVATMNEDGYHYRDEDCSLAPVRSAIPFPVVQLCSSGTGHTCAVTGAGAVWCWGHQPLMEYGETGERPVRIPIEQRATATNEPKPYRCSVHGDFLEVLAVGSTVTVVNRTESELRGDTSERALECTVFSDISSGDFNCVAGREVGDVFVQFLGGSYPPETCLDEVWVGDLLCDYQCVPVNLDVPARPTGETPTAELAQEYCDSRQALPCAPSVEDCLAEAAELRTLATGFECSETLGRVQRCVLEEAPFCIEDTLVSPHNCALDLEHLRACWIDSGAALPLPIPRVGTLDCPSFMREFDDGQAECVKECSEYVMTCTGPVEGPMSCQCRRHEDGALSLTYEVPGNCTHTLPQDVRCRFDVE